MISTPDTELYQDKIRNLEGEKGKGRKTREVFENVVYSREEIEAILSMWKRLAPYIGEKAANCGFGGWEKRFCIEEVRRC